jgi:predicted RND superfamily exporter protein
MRRIAVPATRVRAIHGRFGRLARVISPSRLVRRRLTIRGLAISLAVLMVVVATAAGLMRLRIETTVNSFLPAGDPAVASVEEHARSFGGDPVVAVLESATPRQLLLGDQQLAKLMALEGKLAQLPDVAGVYGPATIMNQIAISSQDMLARISGTRDGRRARAESEARSKHLSKAAVKAAGDAATAEFDKRYGALLVSGMPAGLPTTNNPNFVKNVIYDQAGNPRPQWHFVVPGANSVALLLRPRQDIDQASTQRLVSAFRKAVDGAGLKTSRVTVSGVPAITAGLAGDVTHEMPLLGGLAVLVMLLRFLVAPSDAGRLGRLYPLAAALAGSALTLAVFGWAGTPMSLGAIVLLPLLVGVGSSFPLYLATRASRRRVIAVALASAVAFASLAISPLPFVRELGLALALGVVLTVIVTWALGGVIGVGTESAETSSGDPAHEPMRVGRRWVVLGCLVAVAGLGWALLPRLDIQANPEEMARGLPELRSAQYVEQVLGSSGEVSIVLRGSDVRSPQALRWLRQAEDTEISRYGDQIRPILTAPDLLNFLGGSPTPEQVTAGLQLLPPYLTSAVFSPDGQQAIMTFGLRLQDLGVQDRLLAHVRSALPAPPAGFHVDDVGLPVAAVRAYELVSNERYLANVVGIAAAGVVLLVVLRRRREVLLAMLAAALATGWTIAGLWAVGESLNPLTTALGSLSTVTACEFTVLLIDAGQRRMSRLRQMVGWACVTSAIGYLALIPSRIALLRDFGLTLAITVLLSYLAAYAVVRLSSRRVPLRPSSDPAPHTDIGILDANPAEVSS